MLLEFMFATVLNIHSTAEDDLRTVKVVNITV